MQISHQRTLLALAILALSHTGCSTFGGSDPAPGSQIGFKRALLQEEMGRFEANQSDFDPRSSSNARYEFLRGELALAHDDLDGAIAHFRTAAKEEPLTAPTLRLRLAQVLVRKGQLQEALRELQRLPADETDLSVLELKGGVLASLKKTDEAITVYRRLIQLSPGINEEAYLLLTSLYLSAGRPDEARNELLKLLKLKPSSVFAHYYLGRIAEAEGNGPEAERHYRNALAINPAANTVKLDLARCLGVQKRFREGIELCEEVLKGDPDNNNARRLLSQLLLGANRVDDALKQLETLRTVAEDEKDSRFKIALIKLERRDFTGAETELNLILAQHPKDAAARYYLALAYAGSDRSNDALSQLKQIVADEKLYVESRLLGAHLLRQDKRYPEAIELLEEARNAHPKDQRILAYLVIAQKDAGRVVDAIDTVKRLIELDPKNGAHYFTLGVYYDEIKERQLADQAMEKAIELNPKNANALNYLGYSLAEQGRDLERAEKLIQRALSEEKENAYFIDSLGWVYFRMGRYQDALTQLEKSVALVANDAVLLEHLGYALWKNGKKAEAVAALKKALAAAPASDDKEAEERIRRALEKAQRGEDPAP